MINRSQKFLRLFYGFKRCGECLDFFNLFQELRSYKEKKLSLSSRGTIEDAGMRNDVILRGIKILTKRINDKKLEDCFDYFSRLKLKIQTESQKLISKAWRSHQIMKKWKFSSSKNVEVNEEERKRLLELQIKEQRNIAVKEYSSK